ncbi:hypothetical protein MNV49_001375 [Pseudohyphozyma bogoriensis]|nr:hypothetical protein MNV49_001375 [Pseudohyphozyma bogoriensis]
MAPHRSAKTHRDKAQLVFEERLIERRVDREIVSEKEQLEAKVKELEKELDGLLSAGGGTGERKEGGDRELKAARKELSGLNAKIERLKEEIAEVKASKARTEVELNTVRDKLERLSPDPNTIRPEHQKRLDALNEQTRERTAELKEVKSEVVELEAKLAQLKLDKEKIDAENEELARKLEEEEKLALEAQRSSAEEKTDGKVVSLVRTRYFLQPPAITADDIKQAETLHLKIGALLQELGVVRVENRMTVCSDALLDPHSFCVNEHPYCISCVTPMPGLCPTCGLVTDDESLLKPSPFVKSIFETLEVYCVLEDDGCAWTGKLSSDPDHRRTCSFRTIDCTNADRGCEAQVVFLDLKDHLENCEYDLMECPRGGARCGGWFRRVKEGEHELKCQFHSCPNDRCTTTGSQQLIASHRVGCDAIRKDLTEAQMLIMVFQEDVARLKKAEEGRKKQAKSIERGKKQAEEHAQAQVAAKPSTGAGESRSTSASVKPGSKVVKKKKVVTKKVEGNEEEDELLGVEERPKAKDSTVERMIVSQQVLFLKRTR